MKLNSFNVFGALIGTIGALPSLILGGNAWISGVCLLAGGINIGMLVQQHIENRFN